VSQPHITGTPSASIDVPLQSVACTASSSCIAVGGDDSTEAPSAVAEALHANGAWRALTLPSTLSQSISSAACWSSQCLIGGTQPSGDSLWTYLANDQSVTPAATPRKGRGVSALNCFAKSSCAMVDGTGITGTSRLSFTSDGAATWSAPLAMPWTAGDAVTGLSCTDPLNCLVAATNPNSQVLLEVTHDAGATWAPRNVPSTWITLTSLICAKLNCVALATTSSSSLVLRTSTFARLWRSVTLANRANALACARLSRCVLVGQTSTRGPWLATLKGLKIKSIDLRYVPSPLVGVACGVKTCAAIAASTVLSWRP
jgi:hypothetical protein